MSDGDYTVDVFAVRKRPPYDYAGIETLIEAHLGRSTEPGEGPDGA